jgi:site-specific DNA recombinase
MAREEIDAMVTAIEDHVQVLAQADPNDKAQVYAEIGLRLTYYPEKQLVEAQLQLDLHMCERCVSEGGLEPPCPVKGTSTSS